MGVKHSWKSLRFKSLIGRTKIFLAPFHPWLKPISKKHSGFGSRSEAVTILALGFGTNPIVNSATEWHKVTRELNSKAFEPRSIFIPINMTDVEGGTSVFKSVGPVHMRDASLQKIGPRTFGDGPNLSFGYSIRFVKIGLGSLMPPIHDLCGFLELFGPIAVENLDIVFSRRKVLKR